MSIRSLLCIPVALALAPFSFASIRLYVNVAATPGGNGFTWGTAMNRLEDALAFAATHSGASSVNEIWVAQGTYVPTTILDPTATFGMVAGASMYGGFEGSETQLDQRDPALHLTVLSGDVYGDDGPNFANRGDNVSNVVTANGNTILNSTLLDGFRIVAGDGLNGSPHSGAGLHIQSASPHVNNCTFQDNRAYSGAGVWASSGLPMFTHCRFIGNLSIASGAGGLDTQTVTSAHMLVQDCWFESNINSGGAGGGLKATYADVLHCTFIDNTADDGGAMMLAVEGLAEDCIFMGNSCGSSGGAVWNSGDSFSGAPLGDRVSFVNCLFARNSAYRGGGLAVYQGHGVGPTIVNCTFADNTAVLEGGGLHVDSSVGAPYNTLPIVANTVFWGNSDATGTSEAGQIMLDGQVYPTIGNCDVQGWTGALGGSGNFGLDPQFQDPDGCDGILDNADDDYRLGTTSPCRDAGDDYSLPTDVADQDGDGITLEVLPLDLDGQPRHSGALVDMGAYESNGTYPTSFCFGDGLAGATACPCGNTGAACHGCANSQNVLGATLHASGASVAAPVTGLETLQLHAAGMLSTASAIYLQGSASLNPGILFGDGVRCTGGSLKRLAIKPSVGGASQYPESGDQTISQRSALLGDNVLGSGQARYYQTWYRDPNPTFCPNPPGNGWNVTNGIVVQW